MNNIVEVTESTSTVSVSTTDNKITVTDASPTVTVSAPYSKVGADQLIFNQFSDSTNTAVPENSSDVFTFTGTSPVNATVNASTDTLTVSIDDATTSAKGAASFSSTDFTVSSGAVSLVDLNTTHFASSALDTDLSSVSASDDTLASAKAIKAYVDAQDTGQDLDFTTDTAGNSAVDLDSQVLTFAGGEGIDVTHSGQTITVTSEDSTAANKGAVIVAGTSPVNVAYSSGTATISASDATTGSKGVASFDSSDFSVSSGAVSLADITTSHIATGTLDTDLSSVSGSHDTIPSAKATKDYVDGAASQATTAAQGVGTGDSPSFVNTTLTGQLRGPASFTIDPATVGDNTGTVVIAGNLQVNGQTTEVNSTTLTVDDKNIELGSTASPSDATADGGGITLKGATDKTITWDNTNDNWSFSEHVNAVTGKEYKVNNVSVLNATTLGSSVVNSSLTTVAGGTVATQADATALAIALG